MTTLLKRIELYMVRSKTKKELESMSDRDLSDIGIRRGDIRDLIASIQL